MKTIPADDVVQAVARMCAEANTVLPEDVRLALEAARRTESSPAGREVLDQLLANAELAAETRLPLCQDTGLAVFYVQMGEHCRVEGGLREAIDQGVRRGYDQGYLRKSACDPLSRKNTGDNTPAVVHLDMVPGSQLHIAFMAKGGGSENMSRVTMLAPSQGVEGIKRFVVNRVAEAGPNPCPPIILGVGIGGTFELAPKLAKQALLRPLGDVNPDARLAGMEAEILEMANSLGIGPMGLGGDATCLGVKIAMAPCHIASLPLAVNVQCHSARHLEVVI
jgi:fumarate hydratase subunit alpha